MKEFLEKNLVFFKMVLLTLIIGADENRIGLILFFLEKIILKNSVNKFHAIIILVIGREPLPALS